MRSPANSGDSGCIIPEHSALLQQCEEMTVPVLFRVRPVTTAGKNAHTPQCWLSSMLAVLDVGDTESWISSNLRRHLITGAFRHQGNIFQVKCFQNKWPQVSELCNCGYSGNLVCKYHVFFILICGSSTPQFTEQTTINLLIKSKTRREILGK